MLKQIFCVFAQSNQICTVPTAADHLRAHSADKFQPINPVLKRGSDKPMGSLFATNQ